MLGVKVSKEWFLLFRRNHNCYVMSGALLIANRASLEAFTHEQLIQLTGAAHRLPLHQVTVSRVQRLCADLLSTGCQYDSFAHDLRRPCNDGCNTQSIDLAVPPGKAPRLIINTAVNCAASCCSGVCSSFPRNSQCNQGAAALSCIPARFTMSCIPARFTMSCIPARFTMSFPIPVTTVNSTIQQDLHNLKQG